MFKICCNSIQNQLKPGSPCQECKNGVMGGWCSSMASLGYFQQISHEHLCVGHTHEDVGVLAALTWCFLNSQLDSLHITLQSPWHGIFLTMLFYPRWLFRTPNPIHQKLHWFFAPCLHIKPSALTAPSEPSAIRIHHWGKRLRTSSSCTLSCFTLGFYCLGMSELEGLIYHESMKQDSDPDCLKCNLYVLQI